MCGQNLLIGLVQKNRPIGAESGFSRNSNNVYAILYLPHSVDGLENHSTISTFWTNHSAPSISFKCYPDCRSFGFRIVGLNIPFQDLCFPPFFFRIVDLIGIFSEPSIFYISGSETVTFPKVFSRFSAFYIPLTESFLHRRSFAHVFLTIDLRSKSSLWISPFIYVEIIPHRIFPCGFNPNHWSMIKCRFVDLPIYLCRNHSPSLIFSKSAFAFLSTTLDHPHCQ